MIRDFCIKDLIGDDESINSLENKTIKFESVKITMEKLTEYFYFLVSFQFVI